MIVYACNGPSERERELLCNTGRRVPAVAKGQGVQIADEGRVATEDRWTKQDTAVILYTYNDTLYAL